MSNLSCFTDWTNHPSVGALIHRQQRIWKWRMVIAVNFPIYATGKKKPEKNQGFNGILTRDLRDTGAMLYQLSYEATHWERGQLIEFISSLKPWFFQVSSFQLHKLENLLMIILHFHLLPQFIYELFHIYFKTENLLDFYTKLTEQYLQTYWLGLDETSSVVCNYGKNQTCNYFFTFRSR